MNITCPNCAAQYAVPDDLIPDTGRDVQCSDCQQTWFVAPPDPYLPAEDETPQAVPPRPAVSEDVKTILQEEAARERAARRAEATANASMQVQEDLNIPEPEPVQTFAEPFEDNTVIDMPSRRGLLPDIEDISSTMAARTPARRRSKPDENITQNKQLMRQRRGFRLGLMTMFAIQAAMIALYVMTPYITENYPALADPMNSYVIFINDQRQWWFKTTDGLISSLTTAGTTPVTQN